MASGQGVKRRRYSRLSDDAISPGRHRPILHLRDGIGSTSKSRIDLTRLPPADRAMGQVTGREPPDGTRRKRQGARRKERSGRSEEHTSELQSLMRISYAVFGLKKKNIR